jgi:hypothetical protein
MEELMKPGELSSDALRLIIQIGGVLEQSVLDTARELAARRQSDNVSAMITACDVRAALNSLLENEENGLRCLFGSQDSTRRNARQVG